MTKQIHIGSVSIPLDAYTIGGTALLGIKESGKTYTAKGIAEQLLDYDIPIIVFDAIGVWRFLKVAGEGAKAKGFKVVVAGGKEPDLPLTPQSAPEIVRAAIRENIPLVIDLYDKRLSKSDWRKIVQSCFRTLLYENEGLRHIFLEETAEYAPQKVIDGETYAEVEKLVRMGGNASLGITLINQRAQEVNKAVLDLCENMVLMRQRGAHAIDNLEKWMDRISPTVSKKIAAEMPNMVQGDAWIFAGSSDIPTRTRSAVIRSYHPDRRKPEVRAAAKSVASTGDFVSRLSGELGKLIEEQKANDPAELKKRIRELEKQVARQEQVAPSSKDVIDAEQRGFERGRQSIELAAAHNTRRAASFMRTAIGTLSKVADELDAETEEASAAAKQIDARPENPVRRVEPGARAARLPESAPTVARARQIDGRASSRGNGESLSKAERLLLSALAQYHPAGLSRSRLSILSGYSSNSSSFDNALSALRTKGYINRGLPIAISEDGVRAVGDFEPLPTGQDLRAFWLAKLGKAERTLLDCLIRRYPAAVSRSELSDRSGYSETSSSFDNALSKLRTLELITRGELRASEDLF